MNWDYFFRQKTYLLIPIDTAAISWYVKKAIENWLWRIYHFALTKQRFKVEFLTHVWIKYMFISRTSKVSLIGFACGKVIFPHKCGKILSVLKIKTNLKFYRISTGKLTFRMQKDIDSANFRYTVNKKYRSYHVRKGVFYSTNMTI